MTTQARLRLLPTADFTPAPRKNRRTVLGPRGSAQRKSRVKLLLAASIFALGMVGGLFSAPHGSRPAQPAAAHSAS